MNTEVFKEKPDEVLRHWARKSDESDLFSASLSLLPLEEGARRADDSPPLKEHDECAKKFVPAPTQIVKCFAVSGQRIAVCG